MLDFSECVIVIVIVIIFLFFFLTEMVFALMKKPRNGDKSPDYRYRFISILETVIDVTSFFMTQQPTHRRQHGRTSLPTSVAFLTIHEKLLIA